MTADFLPDVSVTLIGGGGGGSNIHIFFSCIVLSGEYIAECLHFIPFLIVTD